MNRILMILTVLLLQSINFSVIAQSYEYTTEFPSIHNNKSYRDGIGWKIRRVKVTDKELTILFQVDVSSGSSLKSEISGMSSLMCLCDWDDDIRNVINQGRLDYYPVNYKNYWTKIRLAVPSADWVQKIQVPTLNDVRVSYWSSFSSNFTISNTKSTIPYVVEVVFEPIPRGIEEISIIDYFEGNQFEGIKIKNPVKKGIQTGFTENSLKQHWKENGIDYIEGIYDGIGNSKNTLALKKDGKEKYKLIYISGGLSSGWRIGELKAVLTRTATPNMFKVLWYLGDKSQNNNAYAFFEQGSFKILGLTETGSELMYIKLYPSALDDGINFGGSVTTGSGTGFAITANGLIVTNYHVIDGAKSIKVRGINSDFNKTYKAKVLVSDKNNDLALIQIDDFGFTPLGTIPYSIKTTSANVGETIFVLGYPLTATMGEEIKLTNGIISSKSGFQGDITSYQMTAPIQPGNSGAPMFDKDGNIVGIVNAKHVGAENAGYAVKTSYLFNLIDALPTALKLPTINTLKGKTLSSQVELANKFVYIIEVE